MAGLEINCPNCGSGEFELVEAGRHQCVFCRTLYVPPAPASPPAAPRPSQASHVVYVQPPPPEKARPAMAVVPLLIGLAGFAVILGIWLNMSDDFDDEKKRMEKLHKQFDEESQRKKNEESTHVTDEEFERVKKDLERNRKKANGGVPGGK